MVTPKLKLATIVILPACLLAIAYDGTRLVQDRRFNQALGTAAVTSVDGRDDARRQFAQAFDLQQQGEFKAAVQAYAAIQAESQSQLQLDIKYNLAGLYFREALQMRNAGDNDLAMPLIELAKQNYREILRVDSGHWDAKYNIELALVLAPELDPADAMAERNPERSPRAITKMPARKPLP